MPTNNVLEVGADTTGMAKLSGEATLVFSNLVGTHLDIKNLSPLAKEVMDSSNIPNLDGSPQIKDNLLPTKPHLAEELWNGV